MGQNNGNIRLDCYNQQTLPHLPTLAFVNKQPCCARLPETAGVPEKLGKRLMAAEPPTPFFIVLSFLSGVFAAVPQV